MERYGSVTGGDSELATMIISFATGLDPTPAITPFAADSVMRLQDGVLRKMGYQLRSVPAELKSYNLNLPEWTIYCKITPGLPGDLHSI